MPNDKSSTVDELVYKIQLNRLLLTEIPFANAWALFRNDEEKLQHTSRIIDVYEWIGSYLSEDGLLDEDEMKAEFLATIVIKPRFRKRTQEMKQEAAEFFDEAWQQYQFRLDTPKSLGSIAQAIWLVTLAMGDNINAMTQRQAVQRVFPSMTDEEYFGSMIEMSEAVRVHARRQGRFMNAFERWGELGEAQGRPALALNDRGFKAEFGIGQDMLGNWTIDPAKRAAVVDPELGRLLDRMVGG